MPFFFAVAIIFGLILFVPALAVTARRLHDMGYSGWWQLTAYIPYVGLIASIILIVIFCMEGEKKKNKYGKPILDVRTGALLLSSFYLKLHTNLPIFSDTEPIGLSLHLLTSFTVKDGSPFPIGFS